MKKADARRLAHEPETRSAARPDEPSRMRRSMRSAGLMACGLLAAATALAEPDVVRELSGTVVDVQRPEDDELVVVLAVGEDEELTLIVGPDTLVSLDGHVASQNDLDDALGAGARVRYRETESGLLLETIDLTSPEEAG